MSLPNDLIRSFEQSETIEAWFKTTGGGVILGYQGSPTDSPGQPAGWVPALYVGTDGKLYGDVWSLPQVSSYDVVNDGRWHQATLVVDGTFGTQSLYLDGQLFEIARGSVSDFGGSYDQIGTGYTDGWAAAPGGWYGFTGQIAEVRIWNESRTGGEIQQDLTNPPAATEPGLEADYPLDDGQGTTAHDLTSNQNDGTLQGPGGDLPDWIDISPAPAPAGSLAFDGSNYVSLPNDLVRSFEQSETIEAWFKTTGGGVILGYQGSPTDSLGQPAGWVPALYVGNSGKFYGDVWNLPQVSSTEVVNDGLWHQATLVVDGTSGTQSLYLDGQLVETTSGSITDFGGIYDQIGTGYTDGWTAAPGGWYGFTGQIAEVRIWNESRTAGEIQQALTNPPAATEPGLEADYPLDDGQGTSAHDLTSNHNYGTLAGPSGDLPIWVASKGEAVDLGGDGISYNGASPRQGPNNLQNFPIIATTADGRLQGWLGGCTPGAAFRIDVFASASFSVVGAGQAAGLSRVTGCDNRQPGRGDVRRPVCRPRGSTSGDCHSNRRTGQHLGSLGPARAALEVPAPYVRGIAGQPLVFSSASGDGIALEDPDAGLLDPRWDLTLSVASGTLSLSSQSGLVGSGSGTGTLQYQGSLTALNAALEGMIFTPAAGSEGNVALTMNALSRGATVAQAQITISEGFFSVTTTADSGPGSLRQAILDSNAEAGGMNTIEFAIPGQGTQTIALASPLPAVTNPVLIDGFSQPGYSGTSLIVLGRSQSGTDDNLAVAGSDVTVRGLIFEGFALGTSALTDNLTVPSGLLQVGQTGGVEQYQVSVGQDGVLTVKAQADGLSTRLSLLDAQGIVVVQSDGLSPSNGENEIDQDVQAGTYFVRVESTTGAAGRVLLTATFTPASGPFQTVTVTSPYSYSSPPLAIGDFNGDGIPDLATLGGVLLGVGDGTFQNPVGALGFPVNQEAEYSLTTGDFTGNGKLDLAVVVSDSTTGYLLLGNGDGTFQAPKLFPEQSEQGTPSVVVGDFNGDGKLDLAYSFPEGGANIMLLLGNGDGTFEAPRQLLFGPSGRAVDPYSLVTGNFNDDGTLDLAFTNQNGLFSTSTSGEVDVLLGNGNGTFQSLETYVVAGNPYSIVAGDFNGDGRLDLAVATTPNPFYVDDNLGLSPVLKNQPGSISVLLGNGDGSFQPAVRTPVPLAVFSLVTGEFSGNGKLDVAGLDANGEVAVLPGNGDGTFQSEATFAVARPRRFS